jgi:hypothetical protein
MPSASIIALAPSAPMTPRRIRYVFIVSRDVPATATYLREQFGDESEVEVILDRRKADRRAGPGPRPTADRRIGDRRVRRAVDTELRLAPYVFVDLTAAVPAGVTP